jgi:hypothetical protein
MKRTNFHDGGAGKSCMSRYREEMKKTATIVRETGALMRLCSRVII